MTMRSLLLTLGLAASAPALFICCGDGGEPFDPPPDEDWTGCATADQHVAAPTCATTFEETVSVLRSVHVERSRSAAGLMSHG